MVDPYRLVTYADVTIIKHIVVCTIIIVIIGNLLDQQFMTYTEYLSIIAQKNYSITLCLLLTFHSPHCNNIILYHYYNSLLYNELTHFINYVYIHSSSDEIFNERCVAPLCSIMKCTTSKLCIWQNTIIILHHITSLL